MERVVNYVLLSFVWKQLKSTGKLMLRAGLVRRGEGLQSLVRIFFLRSNHQLARYVSASVDNLNQINEVGDRGSKDREILLPIVNRLEKSLRSKGRADADSVLSDLKLLHKMNTVIPLSIFVDTAELFCNRKDPTRAELLIHLCRDNLRSNELLKGQLEEKSAQSRPKDDALNKLVSYTISGLFRHGNIDDASKFWVRMSSSGFVTNRISMEKMLDRLVGSEYSAPSLQLIDSLHGAMKTHVWNQNSNYYVRILKVMRQHIQMSCVNEASIDAAVLKVDYLWSEACGGVSAADFSSQSQASSSSSLLPVEVHALRVHCLTSAMQAHRKLLVTSASAELSKEGGVGHAAKYRDCVLSAFTDLLDCTKRGQQQQELQQDERHSTSLDDYTLAEIVQEVRSILSTSLGNADVSGERGAPAVQHAVGLAAPSDGAVAGASAVAQSNSNLNSAAGDMRRAVSLLLRELAEQGQTKEVQVLLDHYLRKFSTPAASIRAGPTVRSFLDRDGGKYFSNLNLKADLRGAKGVRDSVAVALSAPALLGAETALKGANGTARQGRSDRQLVPADLHYSMEERAWQAGLVCEIMANTNASRYLLKDGANAAPPAFDFAVFKELESTFYALKEVLHVYQLKPGAKFLASFVDALSLNAQHANRVGGVNSISWTASFAAAKLLLDKLDEKTRRSAEVSHSMIRLLCEGSRCPAPEAAAVLKALEMVQEMGNDKVRLLPASLCVLLEAATLSLDDALLARLLSQLEEVLHSRNNRFGKEAEAQSTQQLLKARIFAHCRLREGYRAMQLLRVLRTNEGKAPLALYSWLVNALHQAVPYSSESKAVARSPAPTVNYIVQEMRKDGHVFDSNMVALLLRLFTKAVQLADNTEKKREIIGQMEDFIAIFCARNADAKSGVCVKFDEAILRELVKAHCVSGLAQDAVALIEDAQTVRGLKPTARVYEPVIYQCAVVAGDLNKAEDILTKLLVNKSIPLSDAIVTSFVLGLMRYGELSEALDCIQDMYNQHRVRPTVTTWMALLDASLSRGDVLEARRVVYLLQQQYTEQERNTLVGPAVYLSKGLLSAPANASSATQDSDPASSSAASAVPSALATVGVRRQAAVEAYWAPKTQKDKKKKGKQDQAAQGLPSRQFKLGVPLGQKQRGVLSDKALADRFAQYELSLK